MDAGSGAAEHRAARADDPAQRCDGRGRAVLRPLELVLGEVGPPVGHRVLPGHWNPSEHPYTPPAALPGDGAAKGDFGVADTVDQTVGTLENFKRNTRDCPNVVPMRGASPRDFKDWNTPHGNLIARLFDAPRERRAGGRELTPMPRLGH